MFNNNQHELNNGKKNSNEDDKDKEKNKKQRFIDNYLSKVKKIKKEDNLKPVEPALLSHDYKKDDQRLFSKINQRVKVLLMTDKEKLELKLKNAKSHKQKEDNMTEPEKKLMQKNDAVHHKQKEDDMNDEQKKLMQKKDAVHHKQKEDDMNDEERQNMRFNDAFTRQNKRLDPDIKKKEKYLKYMNDENNLKIYFKDINDTLVNICNSCEQIWFFSSVKYYQVQIFLEKSQKR